MCTDRKINREQKKAHIRKKEKSKRRNLSRQNILVASTDINQYLFCYIPRAEVYQRFHAIYMEKAQGDMFMFVHKKVVKQEKTAFDDFVYASFFLFSLEELITGARKKER